MPGRAPHALPEAATRILLALSLTISIAMSGAVAASGSTVQTRSPQWAAAAPQPLFVAPSSLVRAAYQDFLGRSPSSDEVSFRISTWTSRAALVRAIATSPEWVSTIVTSMYLDTLGRAPDPTGLTTWVSWIRSGRFTVAQVASLFYSSTEFFRGKGGGTLESWVTTLYDKLLHRSPDLAGLQFWTARAGDPAIGRESVAYDFYQSRESRLTRVQALYQLLLHRNPDPTGWPFWSTAILTSGDIELAASLAVSSEYAAAATARYPDPTWMSSPHLAPGTNVDAAQSQQVVRAQHVSGTTGTWQRFQWDGSGWIDVAGPATAIFGSGGVVDASVRVQFTNTTPAGTFPLLFAFGRGNPGTAMPYRLVTDCSWWVQDPAAEDYNRWRESCSNPPSESEHLADYLGSLYQQAVVVGYNYENPIRYGNGSGAGIFLHYAPTRTAGCVAVNDVTELVRTVQWLDPTQHPEIVVVA